MAKESNGNGGKTAFVILASLIAIIAGVYAMVEPMGQRIDFLERTVTNAIAHIDKHAERDGHTTALERHAAARERFEKMDAHIVGLRELIKLRISRVDKDLERIRERIKTLEKQP